MAVSTDTIGGSSGSPVVKAAGEIVGANFDSTVLTQRNAYGYDRNVNRTVIVTTGAVTAALRHAYGMDHLLRRGRRRRPGVRAGGAVGAAAIELAVLARPGLAFIAAVASLGGRVGRARRQRLLIGVVAALLARLVVPVFAAFVVARLRVGAILGESRAGQG